MSVSAGLLHPWVYPTSFLGRRNLKVSIICKTCWHCALLERLGCRAFAHSITLSGPPTYSRNITDRVYPPPRCLWGTAAVILQHTSLHASGLHLRRTPAVQGDWCLLGVVCGGRSACARHFLERTTPGRWALLLHRTVARLEGLVVMSLCADDTMLSVGPRQRAESEGLFR